MATIGLELGKCMISRVWQPGITFWSTTVVTIPNFLFGYRCTSQFFWKLRIITLECLHGDFVCSTVSHLVNAQFYSRLQLKKSSFCLQLEKKLNVMCAQFFASRESSWWNLNRNLVFYHSLGYIFFCPVLIMIYHRNHRMHLIAPSLNVLFDSKRSMKLSGVFFPFSQRCFPRGGSMEWIHMLHLLASSPLKFEEENQCVRSLVGILIT